MNKIGINIFLALTVGLLLYLVSHGQLMLAAMLPGVLIVCKLVTVRESLIYWAILAEFSRLQLPVSAIQNISVAFAIEGIFIAGELLNHFAGKGKLRFSRSSKLLFVFVLFLAVLAKTRGFGIYMFGGSSIGGMMYIIFAVRIAFLGFVAAYSDRYGLNVKRIYNYALAGSIIYVAASMLLYFVPTLYATLGAFVKITLGNELAVIGATGKRISALADLCFTLMPFVMSVPGVMRRNILAGLCAMLAALSGFRTAVMTVLVVFLFVEVRVYGMKARKLILYLVSGAILLGVLWSVAPILDFRIQRALSAIPGFSSRFEKASREADESTEWRIELYKVCLRHIPDYVFIGRGLGSTIDSTLAQLAAVTRNAELHYEAHSYHLAIFEILLDYGILPAFIFFGAIFSRLRAAERVLRVDPSLTFYERYAEACLLAMFISTLTFFSDFKTTYFQLLMYGYVAAVGARVKKPATAARKANISRPVAFG